MKKYTYPLDSGYFYDNPDLLPDDNPPALDWRYLLIIVPCFMVLPGFLWFLYSEISNERNLAYTALDEMSKKLVEMNLNEVNYNNPSLDGWKFGGGGKFSGGGAGGDIPILIRAMQNSDSNAATLAPNSNRNVDSPVNPNNSGASSSTSRDTVQENKEENKAILRYKTQELRNRISSLERIRIIALIGAVPLAVFVYSLGLHPLLENRKAYGINQKKIALGLEIKLIEKKLLEKLRSKEAESVEPSDPPKLSDLYDELLEQELKTSDIKF